MKSFLGWLLMSLGLIFVAKELDDILSGQSNDMVMGFVMAGILIAGGGALLRSARARAQLLRDRLELHQLEAGASRDSLVLQVARSAGGRVTAAEVAADTVLSYEMAAAELERLAGVGACRMVVSEAGVVVYHFPEFEDAAAKGRTYIS